MIEKMLLSMMSQFGIGYREVTLSDIKAPDLNTVTVYEVKATYEGRPVRAVCLVEGLKS